MYKEALQQNLRFETPKGSLSTEQLFGLTMRDLETSIRRVRTILKKTDDSDLEFLDATKTADKENELRFAILKDVYLTRKEEKEEERKKIATKEHNQKILELIQNKKNEELAGKSIEELEKMLQ